MRLGAERRRHAGVNGDGRQIGQQRPLFIDRRVTLLNARKLGLKVNVFIQISLDKQRKAALDVFEREIAVLPEIMECYLMSGDADYLIRALVPDVDALERLIVEHITRIPGVASIRSSFALKQVLYTTAVPLA